MNLSDDTIRSLNRTLQEEGLVDLTKAIQALSQQQRRTDGNVKLRYDGRTDRGVDNQASLIALSGSGKYYNGLFGDLTCFGNDPIVQVIKNENTPPASIGQRLAHCLEWLRIRPGYLNHDVSDAIKAELSQILVDNPALLHRGILLETTVGIKANSTDNQAGDHCLMSCLGAVVAHRNATLPRVSNLMRSSGRWLHAHPEAAKAAGKSETPEDDIKAVLSKRQRVAIKSVFDFGMNPAVGDVVKNGIVIDQDGGQKVRHLSRPIVNSIEAPAPDLCASILEMDEIYRLLQGDNHGIQSFWNEIASVDDLYKEERTTGPDPISESVRRLTGGSPIVFKGNAEEDPAEIGPNAAGRALMMRRKLAASALVAAGLQEPASPDHSFRAIGIEENGSSLLEAKRHGKPTWAPDVHHHQVDNHLLHCVSERFLKEASPVRQRYPLMPESDRATVKGSDAAKQHYAGEILREIVSRMPNRIFSSSNNADPRLIEHNVKALAVALVQAQVVDTKEQAGWLMAKAALSVREANGNTSVTMTSTNGAGHFIDAIDHLGTLKWVDGDNYRVQALHDLKEMVGPDRGLFHQNWLNAIEPRLNHATMLKQVDLAVAKRIHEKNDAPSPTGQTAGLFEHLEGDHLKPVERVVNTRAHRNPDSKATAEAITPRKRATNRL